MRAVRAAVVILILSGGAIAQPKDARSEFEVASIKPAGPLDPQKIMSGQMKIGMTVDNAQVTINSMALPELIMTAFRIEPFQMWARDGSKCVVVIVGAQP